MIKNSENNIQLKNATGYKTVLYGIILILEDIHSQSRAIFNPTNTDMQNMAFLPPLRQLTGFFFGSKITTDGDCSHEIKRHLFLERKVMTKLDSLLKSRDITLPTKVCLVTAMVFAVVMYGCESWTIKKAER